MTPVVLCDSPERHDNLLPLSFTRPIADFRVGISTIADKWRDALGVDSNHYLAPEYLRAKYPHPVDDTLALYIAGHILPDENLVAAVKELKQGDALMAGDVMVAFFGTLAQYRQGPAETVDYQGEIIAINFVFDIFLNNAKALVDDFHKLTAGRESMPLSPTNTLIGSLTDADGRPLLFIEEGASVEGATLNLTHGPIYIGRNAEVMEGACLRGPLAVCAGAHVNMGAKVYGETTVGPFCKVGGELSNVVMFGYSNKSHDGYLGNAVIGEWCNIGAGVDSSNLKNDYSKIRIWNYATHSFMRTDLQFCGLIMGDHSKIGIGCTLNTATVMGVGVNLHGAGFPRTFIPSFSEGSPTGGFKEVPHKKFCDIADRVMSRRGIALTEADINIFDEVRKVASSFRG